ncbi:hypothetical protein HYDPIDRAFT_170709 [Hydnomerulius pinastri MD-312]|uniref:Protein-S-isoprenylcysteine O-methyltransferase n=1 Tax=Hydnomerulius pinastri MD-312 TaxID=994086 RepID=A0A0C9W195_9AGAM|nr:hypothetical protein HYDPIDRAFT_170709 [Hydnomerulius pinastri MD-312]
MTPPNPPPKNHERLEAPVLERMLKGILDLRRFTIIPGLIEAIAIAMKILAPSEYNFASGTCAQHMSLNPLALIACLISVLGMIIRLWCYRTLGKFFTFQLALLPKHKLVTSGPYAYVRHPGYTGGILAFSGATLANATRGSWAYECGLVYSVWGAAWVLLLVVWFGVSVERSMREDEVLRAAFREEWEAWSRKVRWRLVPWVY